MKIKTIKKASSQDWDRIWQQCNYSTYFHSREWADIWHSYTEVATCPDAKLIIFSDGKKALIPLSYRKSMKGLVKNYISSPAGTFGGWLSEDELTPVHGKLLVEYLTQKINSLAWRLNPYDPLLTGLSIQSTESDETHVLDLTIGFDEILKGWSKGHSSAARKAGVIIRKANCNKDWLDYYSIYEDSLLRWGKSASSKYEWSLFNTIQNKESSNITLWLAEYDNKIIAGALCFYAKQHVVYWHGAALEEYFNTRPVNLLMYEIIKDACEQKYQWYDFNPSGGHEGVKNFKKSFGAKPVPSPTYKKSNKKISSIILNKVLQKAG